MRINVLDKTEKLKLGKITELRGNFKAIENEDGVSYECDMFRTKGNETFDELYQAELRAELVQYLSDTNYIAVNYSALDAEEERASFKAEVSNTFGISNALILNARKLIRNALNSSEDLRELGAYLAIAKEDI